MSLCRHVACRCTASFRIRDLKNCTFAVLTCEQGCMVVSPHTRESQQGSLSSNPMSIRACNLDHAGLPTVPCPSHSMRFGSHTEQANARGLSQPDFCQRESLARQKERLTDLPQQLELPSGSDPMIRSVVCYKNALGDQYRPDTEFLVVLEKRRTGLRREAHVGLKVRNLS